MFSPAPTPSSDRPSAPRRGSLRARLVRGLDVAVELVTLGEYGVEEVPVERGTTGQDASDSWSWPARPAGDSLASAPPAREHRLPRLRPPASTSAACARRPARQAARSRAGAIAAPALACAAQPACDA